MKELILLYVIFLNVLGFSSMYIDKSRAKRSKWRIKESSLLLISALGGSIGSYLGMKLLRHKTRHNKFKYGIPLIILIQLIVIYLLVCR
ncbi:DUF1294 domain-containing protein [Clostridium sp. MSJ-4]|uniref:DUF1294 domain-containing protein n=1 Tax=Clostridium simiarum TaxID=2841506 RepID=A0ABS6EZU4_9CLOT|nr:DUF1294 domain-containing protein [Clostridium simiarum]MBU5591159.1 DUF1294 domain-containing protein [Clostridium simiarum]